MSKAFTRILISLGALVLLYLSISLIASISQVANAADRVYLGAGQPIFWLLITIFLCLVASPFILYFKLPKALIPPAEVSGPKHDEYMLNLRARLLKNPRLKGVPLGSENEIIAALEILSAEADKVIKQTASTVFVSTAVMQNGKLDGLLTLATQVRMVWKIASLYHQRPSPRQMIYLYTNVGAAALFAQSVDDFDFSELVTPIVVSIIPSLKGAVPGLQGVSSLLVNSLSSGAANALLTLRVGYVAKQYCEAISAPSRQSARRVATVAALAIIGKITKENSMHIIKKSWGAVSDLASNAVSGLAGGVVDATVKGVKATSGKVTDSAIVGAQALGNVIDSTTQGVKSGAKKITDSTVTGARALGSSLDSTLQSAKASTGKFFSRQETES